MIRDKNSNAVLNTDIEALNKYKMERKYYKRVDRLTADVVEIKQTVVQMCERIERLEKRQRNG